MDCIRLSLIFNEIDNLITLCDKCHKQTHDSYGKSINLNIQQELQIIASMRPVSKNIQIEYSKIIKEQIEPWIAEYIKLGSDNNV